MTIFPTYYFLEEGTDKNMTDSKEHYKLIIIY